MLMQFVQIDLNLNSKATYFLCAQFLYLLRTQIILFRTEKNIIFFTGNDCTEMIYSISILTENYALYAYPLGKI